MTTTTPDDPRIDSRFADPYEETKDEVALDDLSITAFEHGTYDVTYYPRSGKTPQTVRARNASPPTSIQEDDYPDDCVTFFDGGSQYAFAPDEVRLYSVGRTQQNITLAERDDIIRVEEVQTPESAVVAGAEQTGVEATVYYYSDRSGGITTLDMHVEYEDSNFWRISGDRVSDGSKVEVMIRGERDVTVNHYGKRGELHLGKTARVEFPKGHSYTVDVHGLPDDKAEEYVERIKEAVDGAYRYHDVDTEVTHEGRVD